MTALAPVTEPPPVCTAKVTVRPATGFPSASRSCTAGAISTLVPNLARCPLPSTPGAIRICAGGPPVAVAVKSVCCPPTLAVSRGVAVALLPSRHVVCPSPFPPACTSFVVTEAAASSDPPPEMMVKVMVALGIGVPRRSTARAITGWLRVERTVPICPFPETATGATGTCATVTVAVAVAPSTFAVMVAAPLLTAVTTPAALTLATPVALELYVGTRPTIGCPFWSATVTLSCPVAPIASRAMVALFSVTVVALGGSVGEAQAWRPRPARMAAARVRERERRIPGI